MIGSSPDISIIIPVKNGGSRLERVLSAIFSQKISQSFEVITIDSGSTDDSLAILAKFPVKLVQISPVDFSHSKTRNLGAVLAAARAYYVFLNQDAVPSNDSWLENLVYSINFEEGLKAVCATEINETCQVFNVSGVASFLFKTSLVKGLYVIEPYLESTWQFLPKYMIRQLFPFTTVCAIFEKQHFDAYPFDEQIVWGEDLHWAVRNSRMGFKAGCTSFAQVYHFHDYSSAELADIADKSRLLFKNLFDLDFTEEVAQLMSGTCTVSMPGLLGVLQRFEQSWFWHVIKPLVLAYNAVRNRRRQGET